MKLKICLLLAIAMLAVSSVKASVSDNDIIQVSLVVSFEHEYKDAPPKGKRMPSAPVYCIIDINGLSVTTSASEDMEYYEVYDAVGTVLLSSFNDETAFVDYLSELTGEYQIRLKSQNHSYIGNILL